MKILKGHQEKVGEAQLDPSCKAKSSSHPGEPGTSPGTTENVVLEQKENRAGGGGRMWGVLNLSWPPYDCPGITPAVLTA